MRTYEKIEPVEKDTYLRKFTFSTGALVLGRSQGSDIHLFRLFAHVFFVCGDGLNNEKVTVNDEEQRCKIDKYTVDQDIRSGEQVFGQIVGTTSSHVAFGHVAAKDEYIVMPIIYVTYF